MIYTCILKMCAKVPRAMRGSNPDCSWRYYQCKPQELNGSAKTALLVCWILQNPTWCQFRPTVRNGSIGLKRGFKCCMVYFIFCWYLRSWRCPPFKVLAAPRLWSGVFGAKEAILDPMSSTSILCIVPGLNVYMFKCVIKDVQHRLFG